MSRLADDDRFKKWHKELEKLYKRVDQLLHDDEMAWSFQALSRQNEELRTAPGAFLDLIWTGYVHKTAVTIRAMVDGHDRSVSYKGLLSDIAKHPKIIVEQGWVPGDVWTPDGPRGETTDAVEREQLVVAWSAAMLHNLNEPCSIVSKYVNRRVAHFDQRDAPRLSYDDLRHAVYVVSKVHQQVHLTVTGNWVLGPRSTDQGKPWWRVLRFPWLPEGTALPPYQPLKELAELLAADDKS